MRWVLVAISTLIACDRVYGLNGRVEPVDDATSDGADAAIDGSPGPHDEDGDTILDADDNCPGTPNVGQLDDDGDQIGDPCDPISDPTTPQRRLLFDPFTELSSAWTPNTEWVADGDSVGPTPNQPAADGFRLTHKTVEIVAGKPWTIEVAFDLPVAPTTFKFIGVHPVNVMATSLWTCAVYFSDDEWVVTAGGQAVVTATSDPLVLRTRGTGTASDTTICTVRDGSEATTMLSPQPYPLLPQLFAQTPVRYRFIDVIQ